MTTTADRPSLSDRELCGEEFERNLKLAIDYAPDNCAGCADYHIVSALKRVSRHMLFEHGGRKPILDALERVIEERAARDGERIDLVIAACADTGVLSTAAAAAWACGENVLQRMRFTVLDRCPTPLMLCEEFGARHGIEVRTECVDLLETDAQFAADIIVIHNFLPFLPKDRHEDLMRGLRGWLNPSGRMVIWQPVAAGGDRSRFHERQKKQVVDIQQKVESLTFDFGETKESLSARVERNVDQVASALKNPVDPEWLKTLIASADLQIVTLEEIFLHLGKEKDGVKTGANCVLAVAGP